MTARAAWIPLVAQLAAQLAGGPARAEPARRAESPAAVEQRALDHLDRGVAAYRAGELSRARAELTAASALAPDRPNPYRWLALTEVALGDCAAARIHVERFLSRVPPEDPRIPEVAALRERCVPAAAPPATVTGTASASAPSAGSSSEAPVTRRWWFWAAVGAVAITAAGITYGLTRDSPARLPIVTCDPAGCHP
jgi:hypothetical protein